MENIKEFLLLAKERYYEGDPIITDDQYDALEEKFNEVLEVGYRMDDGIPHFARLYSLQKKYKDEDELPSNLDDYVCTAKLDGASIALLYVNGVLQSALTRGDGKKGKDIYDNVAGIIVPEFIPKNTLPIFQIVGEVVAPASVENARNFAAGALSLKDRNEFRERAKSLKFVAHAVYPHPTKTYNKDMEFLRNYCGFETVIDCAITQRLYPVDGLVFRLDDNVAFVQAGWTNKHPRGAFALKERSEGIKTKIINVIWQTGKSGKVTPVAELEPVVIEDAVVSRATLNNVGFIEALDVWIGDEVMVERAGGIIPRIIKKAE